MKNSLSINNVSHFPQLVKRLWACHVLFLFCFSMTGQDLIHASQFERNIETIGSFYLDPDYLYRSGDSFYFFAKADEDYQDLQSEIFVDSIDMPLDASGRLSTSTIMFEYQLGLGFVDYTLFDYANMFYDVSIEGDRLAFSLSDNAAGINGNLFLGSVDSLQSYIKKAGFVIYDMALDSVLYSFFGDQNVPLEADEGPSTLLLDGDYIYVETRVDDEFTFLGRRLEAIKNGVSRTSFIHKVNWKENELIWSKQVGGLSKTYPIININVDDYGNVTLVIRQWDDALYEKMTLDSSNIPGVDLVIYKLDQHGNLVDFTRFDHNTEMNMMWDCEFDKESNLLIYGALFNDFGKMYIINGLDTITTDNEHGEALIMKVNPNLELEWYKLIGGTEGSACFYANFTGEDELIASFGVKDTIFIDNEEIVNVYNENINEEMKREVAVAVFSDSGEIKKYYKFGASLILISNIYEIDRDHYLVMLENRGKEEPIFGDSFGEVGVWAKYIVEVKGDLFAIISSIEEIGSGKTDFTIYPNPTSQDYVTIGDLPMIPSGNKILAQIHDLQGNLIKESTITFGKGEVKLDVSMLNNGIYLVSIYDGEKKYTSKFIKY